MDWTHPKGKVVVQVGSSSRHFKPSKKTGKHVLMVIDGRYFFTFHDFGQKITIPSLPTGTHLVTLVSANGYGIGRITGHYAQCRFHVRKPDGRKMEYKGFSYKRPNLLLLAPRGVYLGVAAKTILGQYDLLGPRPKSMGYRMRYRIDGGKWVYPAGQKLSPLPPFKIWGLKKGRHQIQAQVVDRRRRLVKNANLNDVTRYFWVNAKPTGKEWLKYGGTPVGDDSEPADGDDSDD